MRVWASPFTLYPCTGQHGRGPCGGLYAGPLVVKLVPRYACTMHIPKLKSILKEREIRCRAVVCTATGFSVQGVSYRGNREIPQPILQLLHIALTGHGYTLELCSRDRGGVTHYQFAINRMPANSPCNPT